MTDLLLLAERVEAAEGPDRTLDREIARAQIHWILVGMGEAEAVRVADAMAGARLDADLDAYTASLDAALTLVPEGWTTALYQQDKGWAATLKKGFCTSYTDVVFNERGPNGHPATPALALTAACLRARSTMEGLS